MVIRFCCTGVIVTCLLVLNGMVNIAQYSRSRGARNKGVFRPQNIFQHIYWWPAMCDLSAMSDNVFTYSDDGAVMCTTLSGSERLIDSCAEYVLK